MSAKAKTTKKRRAAQRKRRNQNRKLLREARALTGMTAEQLELGSIGPADAIQQVLDRAYAQLVVASREVDALHSDEIWRDTMVGRIPNEWIRLEQELRNQVSAIAGKMLHLDVEGRKANAAEIMAATLAPVLDGILKDLKLTPKQKDKAKESVHRHLVGIEGGRKAA